MNDRKPEVRYEDSADAPERPPTLVRVWRVSASLYSLSELPDFHTRLVSVPFPLRPVFDLERGVVLAGLWADGPRYEAKQVWLMAERGEGGFAFPGEDTR